MSEPLIFVSRHRVPAGKTDAVRTLSAEYSAFVEARQPRVNSLQIYVDDDAEQMTVVQIQPDTEAMEEHMKLAGERIGQALQAVETESVTVYGKPGPVLEQALRSNAEAGTAVTVLSTRWAGFVRGTAG